MDDSKLQPNKDIDENADPDEVMEILTQKLRDASSIQEIETLTALILKTKVAQQELAIARLRLDEHRISKFDRRITQLRQIIGLIAAIALAAGGPFVLIYVDKYLGTFLMSVGFTSLGLASGIVKSMFDKANKNR